MTLNAIKALMTIQSLRKALTCFSAISFSNTVFLGSPYTLALIKIPVIKNITVATSPDSRIIKKKPSW